MPMVNKQWKECEQKLQKLKDRRQQLSQKIKQVQQQLKRMKDEQNHKQKHKQNQVKLYKQWTERQIDMLQKKPRVRN